MTRRNWILPGTPMATALSGLTPRYAPEADPTPAAAAGPAGDASYDPDPNVEALPSAQTREAEPDEEDGDDDEPVVLDRELAENPTVQKLAKRGGKARWLRQLFANRTRDDVQALDRDAQQTRELRRLAKENPTAVRAYLQHFVPEVFREQAPAQPPQKANGHAPDLAALDFDETALPFDSKANPVNAWFAHEAKTTRGALQAAQHGLQQAQERIAALESHLGGQARTHELGQWKQAIDSASVQIKHDGVRSQFKDLCALYYETAKLRGVRIAPSTVVTKALERLGITGTQAKRANDAATQRVAERNQTLPKPGALGAGGSPATAKQKDPGRTIDSILADTRRARQQAGKPPVNPFF